MTRRAHASLVDDIRVGQVIRAVRLRRRLTQTDIARRAGVCQTNVSLVECGELGRLTLDAIRAVAEATGVRLPFAPRWRGPELDRLLDERHARWVGAVLPELTASGWEATVEYTFREYGDQGSVDILAWRPSVAALLIVEVKTRIVDLQDTLSSMHRKRRVVPRTFERERGMRFDNVGLVLVLPDSSTHREAVARHAAIFDAALPARTRDVRRWLREPDRDLAGVWFGRFTAPDGKAAKRAASRGM